MLSDEGFMLDMLLAARKVQRYVAGLTWQDFQMNEVLQDAVVRQVSVIGEAARMVSQDTKDAHQEIPWRRIVGMRHRLIHEYSKVDLEMVWDAVENDVRSSCV